MSMNILLPVDGSEQALRAVDQVIQLAAAAREQPEVHLLHVHLPIPIGRVQAHIGKETLAAYYREESEAQLAPALARLDAAGLKPAVHIHVGQPAEVITHMAQTLNCGQIVMGTHGRAAVAGLVLGSVASRVVHLASCPVLLVK